MTRRAPTVSSRSSSARCSWPPRRCRPRPTLARRLTPYRGSRLEEQAGKLVAVLGQAAVADDTAAVIHRRARQAARRGVDTFGYGVLYQAEMQRFGEVAEQADARRDKTRKAYRRFKKSIAG